MRLLTFFIALPLLTACGADGPDPVRPTETYPPQALTHETAEVLERDGVLVEVFERGDGPVLQEGSQARVLYTGWFRNTDRVFDSNAPVGPPYPVTIGAGGVIPGWQIGLRGLTEGTKARFHIDWEKAYGKRGSPGIPPEADLVFDIELVPPPPSVNK